MAERRMFAKTIIDSDAFLDMPISSQLLYFHLSMRADDDGFINKPKTIMRMIRATDDDMKLLIAKKFLIPFESGVVVIKHWKIHNYIQNDRYNETKYKEEKAQLALDENKAYRLVDTECIHNVSTLETQVRLGKDRLGKDSKDKGAIDQFVIDNPEYKECLNAYKRMRVDMRRKMQPRAEVLFISKLKELITKGYDGIHLVDMAIEKNWLSVYEPSKQSFIKESNDKTLPAWFGAEDVSESKGIDRVELIKKIKNGEHD